MGAPGAAELDRQTGVLHQLDQTRRHRRRIVHQIAARAILDLGAKPAAADGYDGGPLPERLRRRQPEALAERSLQRYARDALQRADLDLAHARVTGHDAHVVDPGRVVGDFARDPEVLWALARERPHDHQLQIGDRLLRLSEGVDHAVRILPAV